MPTKVYPVELMFFRQGEVEMWSYIFDTREEAEAEVALAKRDRTCFFARIGEWDAVKPQE